MKLFRAFLGVLLALSLGLAPAAAQVARPSPGFKAGFKYVVAPAGATLIGITVHEITTGSETLSLNCGSGCATNDLVVACTVNNGGGLGLTLAGSSTFLTTLENDADASGLQNTIQSSQLGAADAAAPSITLLNGVANYMVVVAIYRGATTAAVKDHQGASTGSTTLAFAGFAPAGGSKGVFICMNNVSGSNVVSVSNGTWTARSNPTTVTGGFLNAYWFDQLSGYASATSTASNFDAGNTKFGYEVEIQ